MTLRLQFVRFLMSSYLYYYEDKQVISDAEFDEICKNLLAGWEDFDHPHKHLITKEDLAAGTGFAIKKYPLIVISSALCWHRDSTT